MKTTDIFNNPNKSKKINESLHKTFGKKINFESFDIPKLEDARNKLRTQIHDARSNSGFNENLENEAFHEAQWMLDAINAELAEREEQVAEGQDVDEDMVRELLKKFDQKANDDYRAYGDVNPETVIRHLEQGDVEAAIEAVAYEYSGDDGEEPRRGFDNLLQDLEDDFRYIVDGPEDDGQPDFDQEYDDDPMDNMMDNVKNNNDVVAEGEVQQASAIVTAKTMVDRVGRWIDELSGMENETMLQLGDSIRDEFGQEQAKAYLESAAPAIEEALNNLKATREALNASMLILTGEGEPPEMLGAEPEEGGEEDMAEPAAPDEMNAEVPAEEVPADDEFAAAEPAAGGEEEAGRVRRESINYSSRLLKTLAG